ncbi:MAG TPA: hypothetical protein VFG37_12460, partial [Planctomycetota bacterium]|nr:hypothetical protein [Planctomycetota bacterium]
TFLAREQLQGPPFKVELSIAPRPVGPAEAARRAALVATDAAKQTASEARRPASRGARSRRRRVAAAAASARSVEIGRHGP